jgi:hypothetical protein
MSLSCSRDLDKSNPVADLEFRFRLQTDVTIDADNQYHSLTTQVHPLKKLAFGVLGFNNLRTFQVKFSALDKKAAIGNYKSQIAANALLANLRYIGPLTVDIEKLEITVEGYYCSGQDCPVGGHL